MGLCRAREWERALRLAEEFHLESHCAGIIAHSAPDPTIKRRALEAARAYKDEHFGWQYYGVLAAHSQVLPDDAEWVRRAVAELESEPDREVNGQVGSVEFRSMRDLNLFLLRDAISSALSREETNVIFERHPSVAQAIRDYQPPEPRSGGEGMRFAAAGARDEIEFMVAAGRGDRSAVPRMMEAARHKFIEGMDPARPNRVPRVFWPSAGLYITAAYFAGRMAGMDGGDVLDHIPDTDIALLARVEFVAGVRGLSLIGSTTMTRGR